MLPNGTAAPAFSLHSSPDQQLGLEDLKGKRTILAFYPADWSPVCGDQMGLYNEMLDLFERHNAQLIGISVDSKWCHAAYTEHRKLGFPLLADFEPKGEVSRKYESFNETSGTSMRTLYVLDEEGIIRWSHLSPVDINPGADGILEALDEMDNSKN